MTVKTHKGLILAGFMLAYCGIMGEFAGLSFESFGLLGREVLLLPVFLGVAIIAIAKLSPTSAE
jgi:hypothetical protein